MNNKRWWMVGSVILAVALLGGMALAQRGPWCPWGPAAPDADTLQQQFGLTDEQAQKVTDLQKQASERLSKLGPEMRTKQQELRTLWLAEKLDEKAIRAKFREVERARTEWQEAQLDYQLELRKALPADQWAQLVPGCGLGWGWGGGFGCGLGPGQGQGRGRGAGWQGGRGCGMGRGPRDGTGPRAGTPSCPWYQPDQ
jgi:Spy/CpxP family protein refolding chaperone